MREHPSTAVQPGAHVPVPSSGILSSWSAHDWSDGIHVGNVSPLERIIVRTANSLYEIIVLSPSTGDILVCGGAFFPVFVPAQLSGSSLGGSFLKLRSVHVGFRLEFSTDRGFILTSPVRSAAIAPAVDRADIM
jgi:hypothetical protein